MQKKLHIKVSTTYINHLQIYFCTLKRTVTYPSQSMQNYYLILSTYLHCLHDNAFVCLILTNKLFTFQFNFNCQFILYSWTARSLGAFRPNLDPNGTDIN